MPTIISEDEAALVWAEQLGSITNDELDNQKKPGEEEIEKKEEEEEIPTGAFPNGDEEEEEEEEEEVSGKQVEKTKPISTSNTAKPGKKPNDFTSLVNEILEKDGFSYDGEIKTPEDAKNVLSEYVRNIKEESVEDSWKDKVKGYSSQVQAILAYADQGAQSAGELLELLSAVKDVEDVVEFDLSNKSGKLKAIQAYYEMKGFKPNYIEKQIAMLKDAGDDVIDETSAEFSEELLEYNKSRVAEKIKQKEIQKKSAENASRIYLQTITDTLKKETLGDIKLTKQDKYNLFEAVSKAEHQSIGGSRVTKFIKTLEDIQFGNNQNYEHFMNIVYYTVDPKGFMEKLKDKLTTEVTTNTMKDIRLSKKNQTAEEEVSGRDPRKVIKNAGFKNPFK